jgi:hypothetical protein
MKLNLLGMQENCSLEWATHPENAIQMIKGGDNMGVTERDFRIAHDIWGKDVTSMRGKTK